MARSFDEIVQGHQDFRKKYTGHLKAAFEGLAEHGQHPTTMVISCCDSRVDPVLLLQCEPGELFVVRNVANIVPPFQKNGAYASISAALEYGVCYLNVTDLVILGHSQCGGVHASLHREDLHQDDFITSWVSDISSNIATASDLDQCARQSLAQSYHNCLTFPWIKERIEDGRLTIHRWFFDIKVGKIFVCSQGEEEYQLLDAVP